MKKVLVLCAAMALFAASAYASGADLSVADCPGSVNATNTATLDCAGGGLLTTVVTWIPVEGFSDLVGVAIVMDEQVGGDLATTATFWDFGAANPNALANSHIRLATTACSAYTNTFNNSGSSEIIAGQPPSSSSTERMLANCVRGPSGALAYAAGQKMFGMQVTIDASQSAENGGNPAALGCTLPACLVLNETDPLVLNQATETPTPLTSPAVFGQSVQLNNGTTAQCLAVPAKKHTWGQLKSLYR